MWKVSSKDNIETINMAIVEDSKSEKSAVNAIRL